MPSLWPASGVETSGAASGPPLSQQFALVGALLTIPVILAYTAFAYYVFRGQADVGFGYH